MDRKQFLQSLYQFCEGKIELRALPSQRRTFLPLGAFPEIDEFCRQNQKEHLYYGIATRDGQGGTKDNIVHIPCLWCDVDYKDTPRDIAAEKFKMFPVKPSAIIVSGGGIHFYWFLKDPLAKDQLKQVETTNRKIASFLGGDLNACDAARIFRIPDTVNHKYPAPCKVSRFNPENLYSLEDFFLLPDIETKKESSPVNADGSWLSEAMQGCAKGSRNATAIKIAGYWINKLSATDVLVILRFWNQRNEPPLEDKELQIIVSSAAKYEPEQPVKRVDISHVRDAPGMLADYEEYIKSLQHNRFHLGIHEIDQKIRGVNGGEVMTIIARAGSFKTALLQNLLRNYIHSSSWGAIFFSLEMPVASLTERFFGIAEGWGGSEVEFMFSDPSWKRDVVEKHKTAFINDLRNLFIVPVKVSLSDVASYVKLIEAEKGVKIGLIGIDYLGLIDSKGVSEYEQISKIATGSKDLAKMLNLPVVLLSQVSRKGGDGEIEISLDMGRGSGAIEEGSDFVLGLWQIEKQGFTDEYDLICRILKNRKGPRGARFRMEIDPKTFRFGSHAKPYEPEKNEKNSVVKFGRDRG